MYPKPAEQKLLSAALRGLKDEELSCELGVSLSFIKKKLGLQFTTAQPRNCRS